MSTQITCECGRTHEAEKLVLWDEAERQKLQVQLSNAESVLMACSQAALNLPVLKIKSVIEHPVYKNVMELAGKYRSAKYELGKLLEHVKTLAEIAEQAEEKR